MSSNSGGSTRNFITMQQRYDRVVLLVDMDCFYCQVEEKLDPSLKGKPLAVVQYNAWRGGGIIAVNYAARAKGVTRHMRGDEAREQCPDIELVKVPNVREKADLSKYRDAGKEVANVLQRYTTLLERASVDEAYLDITETVNKRLTQMNEGSFVLQPEELFNTYAVGHTHIGEYINDITRKISQPPEGQIVIDDFQYAHDASDTAVRQSDLRLLIGASIANEIRTAVKAETTYECSAGIAHNKILAKLACGINKPNKQTILPLVEIPRLFETLPLGKIKGLGGKFGEEVCERLRVRFLGQLLQFTEHELQRKFDEKSGTWLYYMCRGIDLEAVTPRFYSKSIGCCKKFPGRNNITGLNTLRHWLGELAKEVNERLEKDLAENSRKAKQLVVSFVQEIDGEEVSSSRSSQLGSYETAAIWSQALEIIKANTKTFFRCGSEAVLHNPIRFLGISVGKFEPLASGQNKLSEMFANQAKKMQERPASPVETAQKPRTEAKESPLVSYLKSKPKEGKAASEAVPAKAAGSAKEDKKTVKSFFKNVEAKKELEKEKQQKQEREAQQDKENQAEDKAKQPPEKEKQPQEQQQFDLPSIDDFLDILPNAVPKTVQEKEELLSFFRGSGPATDQQLMPHGLFSAPTEKENGHQPLKSKKEREDHKEKKEMGKAKNPVKMEEDTSKEKEEEPQVIEHSPSVLEDAVPSSAEEDVLRLEQELLQIEAAQSQECAAPPSEPISKKRKLAEEPPPPPAPPQDYKSRFVEYAVPELRPELLQYTKCEQCGQSVPQDARSQQLHQDEHFAQQLSKQQRLEFREEVKAKITKKSPQPATSSAKKPKPSGSGKATAKTSPQPASQDISKFFRQTESAILDASDANMQKCDKCHLLIRIEELPEHMDYHVAKELQRQLNQLEVHTVPVSRTSAAPKRNNLNGTLNSSVAGKGGAAVTKGITHFFSQANTRS